MIVDPFTPRNEPEGVCAKLNEKTFLEYATRGGNDAVAALKVLKAIPDIDPKRVVLQGYSYGAISSLRRGPEHSGEHDSNIAGLIAYYPYCYDNVDPSVPTLALIGEKDDWTPAALCQKVNGKPNFEVAVFADSYHGLSRQWENRSITWGTTSPATKRQRLTLKSAPTLSWPHT